MLRGSQTFWACHIFFQFFFVLCALTVASPFVYHESYILPPFSILFLVTKNLSFVGHML